MAKIIWKHADKPTVLIYSHFPFFIIWVKRSIIKFNVFFCLFFKFLIKIFNYSPKLITDDSLLREFLNVLLLCSSHIVGVMIVIFLYNFHSFMISYCKSTKIKNIINIQFSMHKKNKKKLTFVSETWWILNLNLQFQSAYSIAYNKKNIQPLKSCSRFLTFKSFYIVG